MNSIINVCLICIAIIFSWDCTPEKKQIIPVEIIQPDTMAEIMVDIHVAESTIMLNRINDRQTERNAIYIRSVLEENSIDTARFRTSFDYYTHHPDIFSEVYNDVIDKLNEMQALETTKVESDSLSK